MNDIKSYFDNYNEPEYRINSGKGIIIGQTEIMKNLFQHLNQLSNLPTTVLLRGETGTGKELCAMALHYNGNGQRKKNNFVTVNCAGIPPDLLESELFGHTKGSFTGAYRNTEGKFQYAQGGTILLDEIADMSPKLQAEVLRVLQEKQVTRVGSNDTINLNVRVIAATNKNLEDEVSRGNFREDLYYRVNVFPVRVPTLSERKDDIPLIAEYFIEKYNEIYGVQLDGLSDSAKEKLKEVEWRGNVRQLENIVERVFVLKKEGMIDVEDLRFDFDITEQKTKSGKPIEKISRSLYQRDVLPITPKSIVELEGAKSFQSITKILDSGEVYSVRLGQRNKRLIYLKPETVHLLFRDRGTEDYRMLEERIQDNEFTKIAKQPFAFFCVSDLMANPDTLGSVCAIKRAAKKSKAYKVSVGGGSYFAITLSNANFFVSRELGLEHFVSRELGLERRVGRLQETIIESYEEFKNWLEKEEIPRVTGSDQVAQYDLLE